MKVIGFCDSTDGSDWTVLGNDTVNLTVDTKVVYAPKRYALEFDKADGTANTVLAAVYKTIDLALRGFEPNDRICWLINIPDLTNVAYSFVRLGSDQSTNYAEWRFVDTSHTAGRWTVAWSKLGNAYAAGTGLNWDNIDSIAVGVAFDLETNALADILVDTIWLERVAVVEDD